MLKLDRLDSKGIAEILRSEGIASAVDALAEQIAQNVRGQGFTVSSGDPLPVTVDHYTTDRRAASVTINHPAGIGMQAKHGVLTKAAAAAGLEVRAR